jgi:HD superfamily phosphodiesterase
MPSEAHLIDHSKRVWARARVLANTVGGDLEVLVAAAYLHDLARHGGHVIHGPKSADIAKRLLELEGFPTDKIPHVLEAISLHDYQTDPKLRISLESRILFDADKMDAFGVIGVKRHILHFFSRKTAKISPRSILEDHINVKWNSLSFAESRALARKDFEYIQNYFLRLQEQEDGQSDSI